MATVLDHLEFVNRQLEFHRAKAAEYQEKAPRRAEGHLRTIAHFESLAETLMGFESELTKLREELDRRPPPLPLKGAQLSLSLEDLRDLPAELLQELSISDGDKLDFTLQSIIEEGGGVLSLDQVLIALYRKTGEVHKRQQINNRLYRLANKDVLYSVPGKKGVYSARQLSDAELSALGVAHNDT
ncbi:MAG: hypothetical protein J0H00_03940 [Burkholderiales bacterium]|nr:hypothetical protein [Burkholderiales bacterium]OJX08730.1 MAG: hypothetical protein BGO72_15965 [Burkholderiales bacterium 70-64]